MDLTHEIVSHYGWLMNKARRYYNNTEDQKELVAECVYRMLKNIDKFNSDLDFEPWAATVMKNIYIQLYKHRQCIPMLSVDDIFDRPDVNNATDRAEIRDILSMVRRKARTTQNIECVLLYAKGFSCFEISDIIGVPVATVRTRIHYGRKSIREALESE